MISRKSALALAKVYVRLFRKSLLPGRASRSQYTVDSEKLYDFLFARDYDAWFCNRVRKARQAASTRPLQDFIMTLHTGEAIASGTPNWNWEERQKLGQRYLRNLAEDILAYAQTELGEYGKRTLGDLLPTLLRQLELDGFVLIESKLLTPEEGVMDVEEETHLLKSLYTSLGLKRSEVAFHHLDLSEEHYIAGRWEDAISNSRKFLECILREIAAAHHLAQVSAPMSETKLDSPATVREYLENAALLEKKEKETIAKVYSLLSQTGGHPYMAENDQARVLRHLSLTLCQFVLLRYRGYMRAP
jgi:hypothetical protein